MIIMLHNIIIWTGIPFTITFYLALSVGTLVYLVFCAKKHLIPAIREYQLSKEYRRLAKMAYDLQCEAQIHLITHGNDLYGLKTAHGIMKTASSALSMANKVIEPVYSEFKAKVPVVEDIEPPNGDAWDRSEETQGSED